MSCGVLAAREPDVLLPSHGDPIEDPQASLSLVRARLQELVDMRIDEPPCDLDAWLARLIGDIVSNTFVTPFVVTTWTLAYYRLRAATERAAVEPAPEFGR